MFDMLHSCQERHKWSMQTYKDLEVSSLREKRSNLYYEHGFNDSSKAPQTIIFFSALVHWKHFWARATLIYLRRKSSEGHGLESKFMYSNKQ